MAKSKGQLHVDFLRGVFSNGGKIEKANFSLQRGLLKYPEPMFYLTLVQNGVRSLQELPWSPEIESYFLFERPQRMESREEETERFAAILLNNLATTEQQLGDEWIGKLVLLEILRDRASYDLASKLAQIAIDSSLHNVSGGNPNVTSFLTQSIDGLQNTALNALHYSDNEAISLMTAALSIVLDETFGIPARDALFPRR